MKGYLNLKAIILDMYGVIVKQTGDDFVPYVQQTFPCLSAEEIYAPWFKANIGEISSLEVWKSIGFQGDLERIEMEYLDTIELSDGFIDFVEKVKGKWLLTDSVYFAYLEDEKQTQLSAGWENSIYLGTRQNSGSAKKLTGKVLILNVFLNDTFTEWSDADRKKVEDTVDSACEWLITKSRDHSGANLAIDTQSLFYVHSDTVPSNYEMAFLDIMFQKTVYVDVNGYVERNTPDGYDSVCVMFHVWKNGDDYCIPCDTANTDYHTYHGERAMFYYSKNAGHQASSYVYMLLQLFGGEKLYGREDTEEIKALFPEDILLQKNYLNLPLQSHTVSPLTAFLIGWSGYVDTQLIPFTDTQGD